MAAPTTVEINVGGACYATTLDTLTSAKNSLLSTYFSKDHAESNLLGKDSSGRWFIDRDGVLFRYILDYLRNRQLLLPDNFSETSRLKCEAEYYRLPELVKLLDARSKHSIPFKPLPTVKNSTSFSELADRTGCITVGYRGTFFYGRDGLAEVKFRKLCRILICGKVSLCRSVFGETLNENRDADRGDSERYSARFYLKHAFLELAFDMLLDAGFELKTSCGTGTNAQPEEGIQHNLNIGGLVSKGIPQALNQESEEGRWYHYNEFIWAKQLKKN